MARAKVATPAKEEPLEKQLARVAELDCVHTSRRYVGSPDEEDDFNFAERLAALKTEFEAQLLEEAKPNVAIAENLVRVSP